MEKDMVIIFADNGDVDKVEMPKGEAESKYCEIYETMPAVEAPYNADLGRMFLDGVSKGQMLAGHSICHGVLICRPLLLLAYGTDTFIGVVYGCVACTGLTLHK